MRTNLFGLVTLALCGILLCCLVLATDLDLSPAVEAVPSVHLADTIANATAIFGILASFLALIIGLAHAGQPKPKA